MATFELAIPTVLRHEGGYVCNSHDLGGATKYGISLRWLKSQGLLGDVNGDMVVDIKDIQALTMDQAEGFYRVKWWDKYGYGRILDQIIATKVFDTAVNMGAPAAHRIAQKAICSLEPRGCVVDGCLGSESILAINSCQPAPLLHAIQDLQAVRYRNLALDPKLAEFLGGWLNRAYDRV